MYNINFDARVDRKGAGFAHAQCRPRRCEPVVECFFVAANGFQRLVAPPPPGNEASRIHTVARCDEAIRRPAAAATSHAKPLRVACPTGAVEHNRQGKLPLRNRCATDRAHANRQRGVQMSRTEPGADSRVSASGQPSNASVRFRTAGEMLARRMKRRRETSAESSRREISAKSSRLHSGIGQE